MGQSRMLNGLFEAENSSLRNLKIVRFVQENFGDKARACSRGNFSKAAFLLATTALLFDKGFIRLNKDHGKPYEHKDGIMTEDFMQNTSNKIFVHLKKAGIPLNRVEDINLSVISFLTTLFVTGDIQLVEPIKEEG